MNSFLLNIPIMLLASMTMLPAHSIDVAASPNTKSGYADKPTSIPGDYVPTPFGLYVSPKCIITLTSSDEFYPGSVAIGQNGITLADGSVKAVAPCSLPKYNRDGSRYQQGAELMNTSNGNHDLIVSSKIDVPTDFTSTFGQLTDLNATPKNVSGQTIFLTAAMAGQAMGWFQFYAFNLPGHENRWHYGTAIADLKGNVVIQLAVSSQFLDKPIFNIVNDRYACSNPPSSMYRGSIRHARETTAWMNYDLDDMLSDNIIFSIQTFGITSCDMMPFSGTLAGNSTFMIQEPPWGRSLDVTPVTWSSGLCNLKATTQSVGKSQNFTVTYDITLPPVASARSATITYTTK